LPFNGGGSTPPAQNWQVIVTIMKGALAMQTTAGAGSTLILVMMPGNIQFPAVVTANCCASVQSGDAIAAHRAVIEAVDCKAPFVHNNNPASRIAKHSGRNTPGNQGEFERRRSTPLASQAPGTDHCSRTVTVSETVVFETWL
jgi:hypothetical protein